MDDHFRKLERLYTRAPISIAQQTSIAIAEGVATVTIPVLQSALHAAHAAHGSIIFRSLDDAAFFAANSLVPDVFVLTSTFSVTFVRPIASGTITAHGKVVNVSRRLIVASSEAFDEEQRLIATGGGTFMRSQIKLGPDVGYD